MYVVYVVCVHVCLSLCLSVQEPDEADALLKAERSHILTLKKTLEAQLRKVHTQLQVCPSHSHAIPTFVVQDASRVDNPNSTTVQATRPTRVCPSRQLANCPYKSGSPQSVP